MTEPSRRLHVIQWSTGNAGRCALRGILRHPELELVGVHAHSKAKVGKDAAELCGLDRPTGIRATDDVEALLNSIPEPHLHPYEVSTAVNNPRNNSPELLLPVNP